jgi:K+-sensing histidine kinase KdpD
MKFFDQNFLFRFGLPVTAVLVATVTLGLVQERVNPTTVALALLLIVLTSATFIGRNPALLASFVAMLCFNYFFLPPYRTWHIADAGNLVAWGTFTLTAIIAGEMSSYARRRAVEAEEGRREIERLYRELQGAFEKASQAEAFRRSEKLKSSLLDAVTHDLRTPLTSIKASVTTLLESESGQRTIELDPESRLEFLEIIDEETDRLNQFIEGVVELARLEAGGTEMRRKAANVEEILAIALERAGNLLKNHRLRVEVEKDLPLVDVDAKAVAEVVYTLLDNAAKYSPPQSLVTIEACRAAGEIRISVADEGRGIAPELREKVFEKFFQADEHDRSGLGLGLAIARGLVESHGGKIRVETPADGRGAKFVFTVQIFDLS